MKILVFGQLTDIIGVSLLTLPEQKDTVDLQKALTNLYPALGGVTYRIAVNGKMTDGATPILPGAEIALLPPFSGG